MSKPNILIVEDDKHIAKLIKYNLEKAGYDTTVCASGESALEAVQKSPFDLVVLDLMLPGIDGLSVCRTLRQESKTALVPVIMVTAKGEEVDRIVGFELGADDYLVKPFSPRELLLRIKAILRRGKPIADKKEYLATGDIGIDIPRHKVSVRNKEIVLTAMEFKLLVTLVERKGRVQSREILLSDVWGIYTEIDTRTIDTHVKRLRKKLGKSGKCIETVRGMGYRLSEDED